MTQTHETLTTPETRLDGVNRVFFCVAPSTINPQFASYYPPLGLLYLAGTAEAMGKHVTVYDAALKRDSIEKAADTILAADPDLVCITCFTETRFDMQLLAAEIKKRRPQIWIIVGGPHVSFTWEDTLRHTAVDLVAIGEGEAVIRELLAGKPLSEVPGIAYRHDGGIAVNDRPPRVQDLDTLPPPARHLIDMRAYPSARPYKNRCTQVNTNRGCPFGCAYCSATHFWGRKSTQLSAEKVIERITHIHDTYGYDVIFFYDDEFLVNKDRALKLMKLFREKTPWLKWITSVRFDSLNDELLEEMGRSGCQQLNFGLETFNPNTYKLIHRKVNYEKARHFIDKAIRSGVKQAQIYLLIGLPGDDPAGLRRTFLKALSLKATFISTQILRVYPGTIIDTYAHEKRVLPEGFHWYAPYRDGMPNLPTVPIYDEQPRALLVKQYKFLAFYLRVTSLLRRNMPKSLLALYIPLDVFAFRVASKLSGLFKGGADTAERAAAD